MNFKLWYIDQILLIRHWLDLNEIMLLNLYVLMTSFHHNEKFHQFINSSHNDEFPLQLEFSSEGWYS